MTKLLTTVEIMINELRAEYMRRNCTKLGLAEAAGLHPNTLTKFGKPGWEPSIDTLRSLEKALLAPALQITRVGQPSANAESLPTTSAAKCKKPAAVKKTRRRRPLPKPHSAWL
jgi:hypothetical protein